MTGSLCRFPDACQKLGARSLLCKTCNGKAQAHRVHGEAAEKARVAARAAGMRRLGVPLGAEPIYRLARKKKFNKREAAEFARRESIVRP
jgi:hypothetical protein